MSQLLFNYLRLLGDRPPPHLKGTVALTSETKLKPRRKARPERKSLCMEPCSSAPGAPSKHSTPTATSPLSTRSVHIAHSMKTLSPPGCRPGPLLTMLQMKAKTMLHFASFLHEREADERKSSPRYQKRNSVPVLVALPRVFYKTQEHYTNLVL